MWAARQSSDSKLRRNQTLSWKTGYPLAGVWHHSSLRCWETVECGQASFRSKEAAAGDWVLLLRTLWKFIQKKYTPALNTTRGVDKPLKPHLPAQPLDIALLMWYKEETHCPLKGWTSQGACCLLQQGAKKALLGKKKERERNTYVYILLAADTHGDPRTELQGHNLSACDMPSWWFSS